MCIPNTKVCDGRVDCPAGQDEPKDMCNVNECAKGTHGCNQICVDTPAGFYCDCRKGYVLNYFYFFWFLALFSHFSGTRKWRISLLYAAHIVARNMRKVTEKKYESCLFGVIFLLKKIWVKLKNACPMQWSAQQAFKHEEFQLNTDSVISRFLLISLHLYVFFVLFHLQLWATGKQHMRRHWWMQNSWYLFAILYQWNWNVQG